MRVSYYKMLIHVLRNGESIEFNDYTNEEHDLCLCWTNQAVDALNQK